MRPEVVSTLLKGETTDDRKLVSADVKAKGGKGTQSRVTTIRQFSMLLGVQLKKKRRRKKGKKAPLVGGSELLVLKAQKAGRRGFPSKSLLGKTSRDLGEKGEAARGEGQSPGVKDRVTL